MVSLNLPTRNDPISKILLCLLLAAALWANLATFERPTQANAAPNYTIIDATPTPALPTAPVDLPAPALGMAAPTPTPAGWLDQGLAAVGAAGDQFAQSQADQLAAEQAAAAQAAADHQHYLDVIAQQAPHCPRCDVDEPPPSQTGPILYPAEGDTAAYIIAPAGATDPVPAPAAPAIAVAVPHISEEQAAVIAAKESNTCPPGQKFVPRSGCWTPGSSGPQPGPVGTP